MTTFRVGDLISFSYSGEYSTIEYKRKVLILNTNRVRTNFPNEAPKVHALVFDNLNSQEENYIRAVINPKFAEQISQKDSKIRQSLSSLQYFSNPDLYKDLEDPEQFYTRIIKPFIRNKLHDCYRLFFSQKMSGVRIVSGADAMLGKEGFLKKYVNRFKGMFGQKQPQQTGFDKPTRVNQPTTNAPTGFNKPTGLGKL